MQTRWMTVEIDLAQIPSTLQLAINMIESELRRFGEVYSWFVTDVDIQHQTVLVDAIIQFHVD
jgi:hypothetical protein